MDCFEWRPPPLPPPDPFLATVVAVDPESDPEPEFPPFVGEDGIGEGEEEEVFPKKEVRSAL